MCQRAAAICRRACAFDVGRSRKDLGRTAFRDTHEALWYPGALEHAGRDAVLLRLRRRFEAIVFRPGNDRVRDVGRNRSDDG
jgi:hypothetical protein